MSELRLETEAGFEQALGDYLDLCRWRWYHTRRSDRSRKGFGDLVAVRERFVYCELKRSFLEPLSPDQLDWINQVAAVGVETHVLSPEMFDDGRIEQIFGPPRPTPPPRTYLSWVRVRCPRCRAKRMFHALVWGVPETRYNCVACGASIFRVIAGDEHELLRRR